MMKNLERLKFINYSRNANVIDTGQWSLPFISVNILLDTTFTFASSANILLLAKK